MTFAARRGWFAAACTAAFALLCSAYSNSFRNSFHFDDSHVIGTNVFIRSLNNVPRFFTDALTFSSLPSNATYRPLLTLSFAIDYRLGGGLDPFWFHVTQFSSLLVLSGFLVILFRRLMDLAYPHPLNPFAALGAATLFAIHTANTETMNLISARSDIFSTLAVVVAFVVYLSDGPGRRVHLYLIPIAVGALAKAPVVFFAPLLFAFALIHDDEDDAVRTRMRRAFVAALPSLVAGVLLLWFLNSMNSPDWSPGAFDRIGYLRTQPFIWLHYLRLFVLPIGLTADTDLGIIPNWYDTRVIAGLAAILAIVLLIVRTSRTRETRPIAFGLAWFCIALVPTSSVFPLAEVANEHRIFFPYVGLCLAAVWAIVLTLKRVSERTTASRADFVAGTLLLAGFILGAHALGTHQRNRVWSSEETLWLDVTRKSPGNGRALMNYGLTQMALGRYPVARDYFERAHVLSPNYSTLEINLGVVKGATGDNAGAEQNFRRALELSPDVSSHFFYARWLAANGRAPESIDHLREAIRLSPGSADSRALLMEIYAAKGSTEVLKLLAGETIAINPTDRSASAYLQGRIYPEDANGDYDSIFSKGVNAGAQGRILEAVRAFREAVRLRPDSSDAWNNLGFYLGKLGFLDEARQALAQAIVQRPDFALARNNLNWILGLERELTARSSPVPH